MSDSSLLQLGLRKFRACVARDVAPLSGDFFEPRTSTGSGLFALLSRDFKQIFVKSSLYKSKDTYQYKFGSVKAY